MSNLKFGEPVEWNGRHAIVVGVKGDVVDLLLVNEIKNGAGKIQNVVGTARQTELVHFEHDIPAADISSVEDWFFSLKDEQVNALVNEHQRRQHEKAQALQASEAESQLIQMTEGVKIRPSDRVLATAEKLWKDTIRKAEQAGEHDEIELPSFEAQPELWKPWIEQAKKRVTFESQISSAADRAKQRGESAGDAKGGQSGQIGTFPGPKGAKTAFPQPGPVTIPVTIVKEETTAPADEKGKDTTESEPEPGGSIN